MNRRPYGAVRILVKSEPAPTAARVKARAPEHDEDSMFWDHCFNDWNWRIAELTVKAETEVEA